MPKLILEKRFWFIATIQLVIIAASLILAFLFRFDMQIPAKYHSILFSLLPAVVVIKFLIFWYMGLFQGWWRYVSMADLVTILKANVFASLSFVAYAVVVYRLEKIPRSVLILDGIFCFLMMGGIRFVTRAFRENYFPMQRTRRADNCRVLIVGAGEAGQAIAREVRQNARLNFEVVGFIDDDIHKQGIFFQGVKVLGNQGKLARICQRKGVDEVIIAIPTASGPQIRGIVELCRTANVKYKILPSVGDLIDGRVTVQQIRPVDLEDLLGREPVRLDREDIRSYLEGKRVLVTGAAGSIGSELCRQVAHFCPSKLVLFDNAESPLFQIERELAEAYPELHLAAVIGDVRSRTRVEGVFDSLLPQVVFHAAAYKHVPMMELNPAEAIRNNVHGTRVIADAAVKFNLERMVLVSTDKAVNPTNIMGASKRAAELYVQGLAARSRTHFVTVRFGNVLGSAGSVIPIFRDQILKGGPVTVTHPDVTRFFMTIPEAAQLVLQAGSMGQGGEIFLLDMGEPVRIAELAAELIRLSGHEPGKDIEIVFTGLRPGEKLYEELLVDGEGVLPTRHEKIRVASSVPCDWESVAAQVEALYLAAREIDIPRVLALLRALVPEYTPADDGHLSLLAGTWTVPATKHAEALCTRPYHHPLLDPQKQ